MLSEEERQSSLARRAQLGDSEAFSELVCLLSPRMYWVALRLVNDRADAEDVVQDALLSAFRHLPGYRHDASFSTWLTRITLNQAIELLRRRKSLLFRLDAHTHPEAGLRRAANYTPEQICISQELTEILYQCINRMPCRYKTVLRLSVLGELSNRQIAEHLGLTVSNVKVRIYRARQEMQRMLGQPLPRGLDAVE